MSKAWMPFYTGDFLVDTMHLGATERGIYISLIIHCWQHGSIPLDKRKLARIAACDIRIWHQYEETVLQFFDIVEGVSMQHRRVTTELRRYAEISNKRKDAAEQMLKRKRANAEQKLTQSQSQSQAKEAKASLEPRKRGSRLEKDWWPSEANIQYALSHGLSLDRISIEAEKFRNYWTAKAGKDAAKLDWDATWQNWILKASEEVNGHAKHRQSLGDRASELAEKARQLEFAESHRRKDEPFGSH